jgi:hypothetical protein
MNHPQLLNSFSFSGLTLLLLRLGEVTELSVSWSEKVGTGELSGWTYTPGSNPTTH